MSDPKATTAHSDAHAPASGHGADHHPHVLPMSTYLAVFGTLLVLTGITVWASRQDFGNANLIIALGIATVKAMCVALIFMHLAFDKKFNAIVFASSLIFLAIFIGFTMADTSMRGHDARSSADGPANVQDPFGQTRSQAAMQAMYEKHKPGEKEVPPMDRKIGIKSDLGIYGMTPNPAFGDAVSVDVPDRADTPGAEPVPVAAAEEKE